MSEEVWLGCADPGPMLLQVLEGKVSQRKMRLFAAACCRRIWHLHLDKRGRNAVEVTERQAAGLEGPFQPAVRSPARTACTPSPSKWSLAR